jgi:hypothetical protein
MKVDNVVECESQTRELSHNYVSDSDRRYDQSYADPSSRGFGSSNADGEKKRSDKRNSLAVLAQHLSELMESAAAADGDWKSISSYD